MPRMLSIEWDQHEARFVVATLARGRFSVEQAGSVPFSSVPEGEKLSPSELGEEIRDYFSANQISAGAALVAISRSNIELAQLGLPPTPDDELPDLVRYQASRELSTFTDGAMLDYVPLPAAIDEPRTVLAAALSRDQFAHIQAVCSAAGIKPHRLLVRPHAAGSLFFRQVRPSEAVSLLVTCFRDEADLAVLVAGQVLLCRTVRLPQAAAGDTDGVPILAEIRRTIFAVQNQPGGGQISAVYICGSPAEHRELVELIQNEFSLAAEIFQPFHGLKLSRELQDNLPANPGCYAALLGMLSDEAHATHSIDFLHPRKKAEPASRRRRVIAASAAAIAVLAFAGHYAWSQFSQVNKQIAELNRKVKRLDDRVKSAVQKEAAVAAIEEWRIGDVDWLDELRDLSLRFPKPRDAVVQRMTLAGKPTGGGAIELEGLVRDPSIVGQMESGLRDDYHEVRTKRVQESAQGQTHTWKFDSSLLVATREKDKYQSHLPAAPATAASQQAGSSTAEKTSQQKTQAMPRVASRDAPDSQPAKQAAARRAP